jgi:hypothetical protein
MFRTVFAAAFTAAALAASPAGAQPARLQVGTLNCSVSAGIGLLVGSQRNVSCLFHTDNMPDEAYTGKITRIGVDIGVTNGAKIIWAVFATTNRYAGMLAGDYVGATAEATVAVGLGANALVGGSNRSVALQPLSIQGQTGFNIAAGIGNLSLCAVGTNCPAP